MKQTAFQKINWQHRYAHGGSLRQKRAGRKERAISLKDPIHLVLKTNRECVPGGFRTPKRFRLIHQVCDRYSKRFFVKIEKMSVQGDHLHLIVRATKRSGFQHFLRVFTGQIAQQFENKGLIELQHTVKALAQVTGTPGRYTNQTKSLEKERRKLWKYRPFTRVVKSYRAYLTLRDYVQLNEQEARGQIRYRGNRLKALRDDEWRVLWGS
jgi:REP element-mobilizing transposase RayT